jgi:SAM-dependent MidA family methyltransferase
LTAEPFPAPDPEALEVSARLVEKIRRAIDAADGWLGFEQYMQLALHEPGLGYYSAGAAKLGAGGDFTTAPELGDWLAGALAPFIGQVFDELGSTQLLELGAGTGRLAGQLLEQFAARGYSEIDYSILETSADLRARQREHLNGSGCTVRWLDQLPAEGFRGVVLANEVADAIPAARFIKSGGRILPLGVSGDGEKLAIVPGPADDTLTDIVLEVEAALGQPLPDGYRSEVRPLLGAWLAEVLGAIAAGGMMLIDYGMPRRDYFRPERSDGTLICHYRQRAHADPLLWPGLQDITAWVDFSAVASAARASGFQVAGFTNQAQFLLESIAQDPLLAGRQPSAREASAIKTLVLPGEMGERFKLIWLTRGDVGPPLPGRDFRNWL